MNNTTILPTTVISNPPSPPNSNVDMVLQVLFGVIAAASFLFNLLFCVLLLKRPSMLKKGHNILLFSLAVVDMLTGEFSQFSSPRDNYNQSVGKRDLGTNVPAHFTG